MAKPRILVVDDDSGMREALQQWFQIRGFSVDTAHDGLDAIQKCETSIYDIITMDLEMPRAGGLEAMEAIKRTQPGVHVIVITGYAKDTEKANDMGAFKVLHKPIRLKELEDQIRELLVSSPVR